MDNSQKQLIRKKITQNKHEIYVLEIRELDLVVQTKLRSPAKINQKKAWDDLRGKFEGAANYTATAKDIVTITKVFADLGFAGTKAYVKYHQGKAYVIFKGQPGLRTIFTGTRYGLQNVKIIQMGLGKHGALQSAKSGGILTVILVAAYRIADYILSDQQTLNQLIGTLATDVVKIGIATGASIVAGMAAAAVFTVAIGPLVAAIAVGLLVSYGLGKLDENYAITEKVISALDELESNITNIIDENKKKIISAVDDIAESVIDYAVNETQRIAINTIKHHLYRMLPPR